MDGYFALAAIGGVALIESGMLPVEPRSQRWRMMLVVVGVIAIVAAVVGVFDATPTVGGVFRAAMRHGLVPVFFSVLGIALGIMLRWFGELLGISNQPSDR
jgi:hypothetical protein